MRWLPLMAWCGCASMGAMQTADTLGKGKVQLGIEYSQQAQLSRDTLTTYPMLGASLRVGIHDRFDLGIRAGPTGGEVQPKLMLTKKGSPLIVSVAPSFGLAIFDTNGITLRFYNLGVPILFGVPVEGGHQWVFSARFNDTIAYESAGSARGLLHLTTASVSVGFAVRVWKMIFMPELAVGHPLWTFSERSDVDGGGDFGAGRTSLQLNLAVMFGGTRP